MGAYDKATDWLDQQTWDQIRQASGGDDTSINSSIQMFAQQYKTLTGQNPGLQEIQNFAKNALMSAEQAPGNLGYSDSSSLVNNYLQQTFPDQIAANSQQKQTDQLGKTTGLINNLVGDVTGNAAKLFSDPNSSVYQAFAGNMNNSGITPSSGAFQAGAGNEIAGTATSAINNALQSIGIPAIGQIQGMSTYPLQQAQSQSNLGHLNQLGDFGLEQSIAQMLQNQMQPSGFEKGLGYANTASSILGNLTGSASNAKGGAALTWICTEMKRQGVLSSGEVDRLHNHLFPSIYKRFWKFMGYFVFGKFLVLAATSLGVNWLEWRSSFYDSVISEPDSLKSVDLYEESFWRLAREVKHRIRVKTLFIYDNPEAHHGS